MAEGTKIRVCVVDRLHVDLAKTGVPLSICLLLQQQSQWSAKQCSVHNMGARAVGMLVAGGNESVKD